MHTTAIRKIGGSAMLIIPPSLMDQLHVKVGSSVEMEVVQGCLMIEPKVKPRYTLSELLAKCDANAPMPDDLEWLNSEPVGHELI